MTDRQTDRPALHREVTHFQERERDRDQREREREKGEREREKERQREREERARARKRRELVGWGGICNKGIMAIKQNKDTNMHWILTILRFVKI